MPIQISCPSCKGAVRVPEDLLGMRVQCPRCQATFVSELAEDTPPVAPLNAESSDQAGTPAPKPGPRRAPKTDEYDEYDDYDEGRQRYGRPHRGAAILTLGILSLVMMFPMMLCGPFGLFAAPLGIVAWIMGGNDLAEMRRGGMDRSGEGLTQAGRILGIVSTVLMILGCVIYGFFFALMGAAHRLR